MTLADRVAGRHGATDLRVVAPGSYEHRRIVDILAEAYPTSRLDTVPKRDASFAEQRDVALRSPEHVLFGAFRDGALAGTMRVYDFCVNVRGAQIAAAGIGSLAVALESKRRGVARDCLLAVLDAARETGVPLATLYAFRADFYAAFGFAAGAKLEQYRLPPAVFPAHGLRERVRRLHLADADAYGALHARLQARTHGLFKRERWRTEMRLENLSLLTFGYEEGGGIGGSLAVEIKLGADGTWNRNELIVHELAYESPAALHGFLAFLHSQSDQFGTIVMNTLDPDLHVLFTDARNGSGHNLGPPSTTKPIRRASA